MISSVAPRTMMVLDRSVYRGPHLYSARPMVRIQLDLGTLESYPTNRLPGFTHTLMTRLPGLRRHGCSYGQPDGLHRRMTDGTWLGHVIEHVALELQSQAGARATRGKTRSVRGRSGVYDILFAYEDETAALLAGRTAVELVDSLLPKPLSGATGLDRIVAAPAFDGDVGGAVARIRAAMRRSGLGPSTASLVTAARRRGIPVQRLNEQSLIQLGWGARQRRLRASATDRTGLIAAEAAGDKAEAKNLMRAIGLPVAAGETVRSANEALAAAARLARPLVVKPVGGNHGRGVRTGLVSDQQVTDAFVEANHHGRRVLVESQLPGRDYRVLVVDGRVVAVSERSPAQVVGDGGSSIRELVEAVNADPRRGDGHEGVLTRIKLDEAALDTLSRQELALDDVPEAGRIVMLRGAANLSGGGTASDRTDVIHPENASIARRAALVLGLDVAGVDLLAPDIARSVRETGGGIVEVNAAPGLRMHLAPSEGLARDVAAPILAMLYPPGSRSRIPILAVTGTNGKSTVGRMLAHIFKATGQVVGLTNTSGVYIGDERVKVGDASGPKSARMVLRDPTVEVAVLECARGGILREGLAFDRCDVGCVLNVQPDHLGLKGVDSLKDLAAVKSVVVESVSRRGVSVLNADDTLTIRMARHAGGRVAWFTMRGGDETPGFILKHIAEGGLAVLYDAKADLITLHDRGGRRNVCAASAIPATLGGLAAFNVQNALAAIAMAYGAGIQADILSEALQTFSSSYEQNPGRMNLHEVGGVTVVLDYAHNPEALRALGRATRSLVADGGRIIAMVSIPGDRRDSEIVAMGEIAAEYFDRLIFRETPDNRGRPLGEVMRLLYEGAAAAGYAPNRVDEVADEDEAAQFALASAKPGDLVVLTPTRVAEVWDLVQRYDPGQRVEAAPEPFLEPPHG